MAHEIDTTTGKASIFTGNGQKPWHGLGVTIAGQATSAEAIKLAGLDWSVLQLPLFAELNGAGTLRIETPDRANVRSDTGALLGTVGAQYQPLQNSEAFAFMDGIVGEGQAAYHTAGAVFGGKKVWMLAKLPRTIKTTRKDVSECYLLLTNCHDGTEAMRFLTTTVRVVCNNTLSLSLNAAGQSGVWYRHTGDLSAKLGEARKMLGMADEAITELETATQKLAATKLTAKELGDYAQTLFPHDDEHCAALVKRMAKEKDDRAQLMRQLLANHEELTEQTRKRNEGIVEQILANHENERQAVAKRGTAWAAYNAVSEWVDWQRGSRTADKHFATTLFGKGNDLKIDALDLAVAYADASAA